MFFSFESHLKFSPQYQHPSFQFWPPKSFQSWPFREKLLPRAKDLCPLLTVHVATLSFKSIRGSITPNHDWYIFCCLGLCSEADALPLHWEQPSGSGVIYGDSLEETVSICYSLLKVIMPLTINLFMSTSLSDQARPKVGSCCCQTVIWTCCRNDISVIEMIAGVCTLLNCQNQCELMGLQRVHETISDVSWLIMLPPDN